MTPKEDLTLKFARIILVQGFASHSLADLTKQAAVSRALVAHHFKNQDAIVEAVVDHYLAFLRQRALPATPSRNTLPQTLLNALWVLGAVTPRFATELQHQHPRLYRRYNHGVTTYLRNLASTYQRAQAAGLMRATGSPNYLLFQQRVLLQGTLQAVQTGELSLEAGEAYLRADFTLQCQALLTSPVATPTPALQSAIRESLSNYYATYALVNPA